MYIDPPRHGTVTQQHLCPEGKHRPKWVHHHQAEVQPRYVCNGLIAQRDHEKHDDGQAGRGVSPDAGTAARLLFRGLIVRCSAGSIASADSGRGRQASQERTYPDIWPSPHASLPDILSISEGAAVFALCHVSGDEWARTYNGFIYMIFWWRGFPQIGNKNIVKSIPYKCDVALSHKTTLGPPRYGAARRRMVLSFNSVCGLFYLLHSVPRSAPSFFLRAEPNLMAARRSNRRGSTIRAISAFRRALNQPPTCFGSEQKPATRVSGGKNVHGVTDFAKRCGDVVAGENPQLTQSILIGDQFSLLFTIFKSCVSIVFPRANRVQHTHCTDMLRRVTRDRHGYTLEHTCEADHYAFERLAKSLFWGHNLRIKYRECGMTMAGQRDTASF